MTDKRDNNEFGFEIDDVDALKQVAGSEAAELELELDALDIKDDETVRRKSSSDDYLDTVSSAARAAIESEEYAAPTKGKSSSGLVLSVAGIAITLAVVAGGYFFVAPMVLGGGQSAAASFQSAPSDVDLRNELSFSQQGAQQASQQAGFGGQVQDLEAGQDVANDFGGYGLEDSSLDSGVTQALNEDGGQFAFSGSEDLELGVSDNSLTPEPYAAEDDMYGSFDNDGDDVVITHQVSDEERMYDNILAEASMIDAPHEAIKIDRNVVTMELQVKRISRAEMDIADTRKSLSDIVGVIGEIRQQTSEIAKAIEINNADSKRFSNEIKQLTAKVEGQIEAQNSDIAQIRVEIKNIAEKPAVQVVAKVEPKAKPTVAAKPAQAEKSAASNKVAEAAMKKAVSLPAPKPRPVTVKAPTPRAPAARATCSASKVSDNWRVKGVTPSSAYVERIQDGQGLLLKAGVSLPGFGTVESFNPVERSVCTTNGIVRR